MARCEDSISSHSLQSWTTHGSFLPSFPSSSACRVSIYSNSDLCFDSRAAQQLFLCSLWRIDSLSTLLLYSLFVLVQTGLPLDHHPWPNWSTLWALITHFLSYFIITVTRFIPINFSTSMPYLKAELPKGHDSFYTREFGQSTYHIIFYMTGIK